MDLSQSQTNVSASSASAPVGNTNTNAVKEIEVTAKQIVDRISGSAQLQKQRQSISEASGSGAGSALPTEATGDGQLVNVNGPTDLKETGVENSIVGNKKALTKSMRQLSIGSVDGQISAEQKAVEQLLKAVEKWVQEAQSESESDENEKQGEKEIDNLHWVYSIESYLRSLDTDWTSQKSLTHKLASQLLTWLKNLFHFSEKEKSDEYNSIHPHWDINGGLTAVIQMSLYLKFPNLYSLGYQYFQDESKTPVIYCSDDLIGQQICSKIGLPYNSISVVDFTDKGWVDQFESRLKSDFQSGKVPVALLINTAVQNLEKGVKLAESHKVWVHFYGSNVLAYFLKRPESSHLGSSFTLDLTRWLKTPKLPYLTLYKRPEKVEPRVLEMCDIGSPRNEIMCFTPWFVAHVFGKTRLTTLVNEAIYRGKFMLEMVQRFQSLTVVPNWSTLSDGHVILSTLTFQFNPPARSQSRKSSSSSPSLDSAENSRQHSVQYLDTLNSWLYHIMERDLKNILPLEFVFVETRGWNLHIDIVRTKKLVAQDEATILATFENHMQVLQATVNQKIKFQQLVEDCEEMDWVNNENQWAGLGAVRYIPSVHRAKQAQQQNSAQQDKDEEAAAETNANANVDANGEAVAVKDKDSSSRSNGGANATSKTESVKKSKSKVDLEKQNDKVKEEIDHLNAQIVNKLRAIDSAFSLGEAPTGDWCVQFGMVTDETDVQELVRLVAATGQEIEESSEFFNRMSELVRKGIHEAEEQLQKESEEALWEEGILRRVPIVGTFVSWFSPPAKESGVRGRALNLTQGKVESTENIYKYHMQVEASTFTKKASQLAVNNQTK